MTVKRLRGTAARDILKGTSLSEYIEGYAGDDDLYGGAGDDTLSGGAGADRMFGGLGGDTYLVDNVRDQAIEEGSGNDLVESFVNWTLGANFERLTLRGTAAIDGRGNGFHNTLYGNDAANDLYGFGGSDILSAGLGADRLFGGTGNERYDVFDVRTRVFERAGEGYDRIMSFGISYTMGAHTEELRLMGGDGDFNGTGNNQDNKIYGGGGKNVLRGLGGNDTLDGGGGADRMYGGTGNDVYYVNRSDYIDFDKPGALNAVDVVIEAAGEGIDTVYSDGNFVLGANIENLTLTGTLAPWGLGNALNNIIIGNTSSNILNGGAGADRLIGGRGADTYYVDNVNDVIVEEALQGPDVVRSTVSYTLPDNVERLVLLGTAEIEGNGNSLHNVIVGNSAYNILRGGAGNDILDGGGSELNALGDAMVGGTGNDVFVIRNDGSPDVIADMGVGNDRIRLVTGTFGNIGPLTDGVNFFNEARLTGTIGTGPTLIYRDGILWFDSNGSTTGGLEPVLWFSLDPQPAGYTTTPPATLSVSQFELIA